MKHIRAITCKPEAAQTNFQALIDFVVGIVQQVVDLVANNFTTGSGIIFNKNGGAIR